MFARVCIRPCIVVTIALALCALTGRWPLAGPALPPNVSLR